MEGRHMGKDKIQLLNQALNAASSSLNLAKQLISEIAHHSGTPEMPGLVGKYDGMFMVTEAGNRAPARLLGSRNEPSKEEKKEEPAKDKKEDPAKLNAAKSASGGKTSKPIDEEELR